MATCKECIHNDVCQALEDKNGVPKVGAFDCGFFASHSLYIKKPCEIGTTVYGIIEICNKEGREETRIFKGNIASMSIEKDGLWIYIHYKSGLNCWEVASQLNKTIFFYEEDARKALTEENIK